MANYCRECGSPLDPNMKFCTNCGTPIPASAKQKAVETSTPADRKAEDTASLPAYRQAAKAWKESQTKPSSAPPPNKNEREAPSRKMIVREKSEQATTSTPRAAKKRAPRWISFLLVLVLIAELFVAGFYYPGILRKSKKSTGFGAIEDTRREI